MDFLWSDLLALLLVPLVLVAIGSRVRDLVLGPGVATKNCVVAIVDAASMEAS